MPASSLYEWVELLGLSVVDRIDELWLIDGIANEPEVVRDGKCAISSGLYW